MEQLMTQYSFDVKVQSPGLVITLTRLADSAVKVWTRAAADADETWVHNMSMHMKSLTDELCESFFPHEKVKKEKVVSAPDLNGVKNLRVQGKVCFIGKNQKFAEVTTEVFHAELVKRYGKDSANKWLEEFNT
jgi:hypothetical protein